MCLHKAEIINSKEHFLKKHYHSEEDKRSIKPNGKRESFKDMEDVLSTSENRKEDLKNG